MDSPHPDTQGMRNILFEHGFTPTHRLLLEGPPGTGKTLTASILAHELALPMFTVRLDSILSKYMGETAGKLRIVFDSVAERRGVYLFDEFDALGGNRSANDIGEARRILSSFLIFLEQSSPESIVVAATNHRSILDKALFRRFEMVLSYGMPDQLQAKSVMRRRLGSLGKNIRWDKLDNLTENLSHAELIKATEDAAKAVLMRNERSVRVADLAAALENRRKASIA